MYQNVWKRRDGDYFFQVDNVTKSLFSLLFQSHYTATRLLLLSFPLNDTTTEFGSLQHLADIWRISAKLLSSELKLFY